jgi:two-component system chemotaxis sensor kinase CheA
MDVVRRNIKSLGGSVEITSVLGKGTTFAVRLPLTLSILDGQLVRVGDETYVVPLVSIVESLQMRASQVNAISGRAEMYKLRNEYIPIIRLHDTFGIPTESRELDGGLMMVVEGDGRRAGLVVDDLLAQQQVVIKSLETNFRKVEGLSGATILGDGTVALILDTAGLVNLARTGAAPGTAAA